MGPEQVSRKQREERREVKKVRNTWEDCYTYLVGLVAKVSESVCSQC